MADTKISAMTAATDLTGAVVPIVQSGANKKADISLFGATGYKVYTALLTQSGTDAPVATVLQNTLGGAVVWTRNIAGSYTATLAGAFTANKTIVFAGLNYIDSTVIFSNTQITSTDEVYLFTYYSITDAYTNSLADFVANSIFIEIRVYP